RPADHPRRRRSGGRERGKELIWTFEELAFSAQRAKRVVSGFVIMEAVRQDWSDDRLDHLNRKVDEGFASVDLRFAEVDRRFDQVDKRFEQVDQRFEQIDKRFEQVDQRFEQVDKRFGRLETELGALREDMNTRFQSMQEASNALHRTMVQFAGASFAAFAALFSAQIALFLTLL
ncbi:MAG TPA: hypothetical protein VFT10_08305, partial [Solirubrobacterales bacterium]|nr:hypothetical protein [Solirubrobacterales bacterium]